MVLVGAVALGCRPCSMVMQLGYKDGNGYMRSDLAEATHTRESVAYSKAWMWRSQVYPLFILFYFLCLDPWSFFPVVLLMSFVVCLFICFLNFM